MNEIYKIYYIHFYNLNNNYCLLLDIFSQNDISEIAPESKLIVDESIKNSDILKRQQINGCKSDEICTTPKKNNGQC